MHTFKIEVQEFLARTVEIEADSIAEAISQVKEMYRKEEIVLDADDYVRTEIEEIKNN